MMARRKHGPREPNGRHQRAPRQERADEVRRPVYEARQRVFGVTRAQAEAMPVTSFLGALVAAGEISQRQLEAAHAYLGVCRDYDRLHPSVRGYPESGNLDRGGGYDASEVGEDYLRRFRKVTGLWNRCERALRDTFSQDVRAYTVTQNVVLQGYHMPSHVDALRIGLNALAHVFGLPVYSHEQSDA